MFEGINEVAVLVSAILAIAVGSIWYSPVMLGTQWMRAVGLTEADMERMKERMLVLFTAAALINLFLALAIATFMNYAKDVGVSVYEYAIGLTVIVVAFIAANMVWEGKPLSYLFINGGYAAAVILGMTSIISYWPW